MKTKTTKSRISKAEREAYALVGRKGGLAIAKKLGKKGMSKLGSAGAAKRWPKIDNGTKTVYIPTPKGWKCPRKGCTTRVKHSHGTFSLLKK